MCYTYYESDNGSLMKKTEPGWYISYSNKSGDSSCIGPIQEPIIDNEHADKLLKEIHIGDWDCGKYYAHVTGYGKV